MAQILNRCVVMRDNEYYLYYRARQGDAARYQTWTKDINEALIFINPQDALCKGYGDYNIVSIKINLKENND